MKCTTDSGPFLINELNWNGANFFLNVIRAIETGIWEESGYLGDNFRKLTGAKKSKN